MKNAKLKKSLNKYNKSKEDKPLLISGELGVTIGGRRTVEVAGREGFVYVKLKGNTSELIQAFNAEVAPVFGMPVFVRRSNGIYKVVGRNIDRYQNQLLTSAPFLPKHGAQHSFNHDIGVGGDVAWIYSQQFMPLLSYPSGTSGAMSLVVHPHFYEWNGQWKYSQNTGTPSYTPYLPTITGSARMVLSYIDPSDNSIKLVPGTPFSDSLTGSSQIVDYIPDIPREIGIPLAAVRLLTGTTTIGWENIYDMRDFYTVGKPSGSTGGGSGGIAGVVAQDEGITLGTGTIFNFVGPNVDASISGSVIRVFVTGSTGGGSVTVPVTGTIVVADDGVIKGSASILNFGSGLSASLSGTYAQIDGNYIYARTEDLTPYISGSNQIFPLLAIPATDTLRLFYNGVRQRPIYHYTVAGQQVNTVFVPTTGSILIADYSEVTSSAGLSSVLPGYINWYENGSMVSASGTTNEITLFSGAFPGGALGNNGAIYIDSLVDVNHAVVGTATLKLYYGSQSMSIAMAEGAVTASKPGRITFRIGEKGGPNSQYVEGQTHLADGANLYWKRNASVFNVDSTSNQRLQLTVQWGGSDNGLAYTQHHVNVGYYPGITGTSPSASIYAQDEGVPLSSVNTFNFVGSPVSVTVSGTVARVFVTGSSGGSSTPSYFGIKSFTTPPSAGWSWDNQVSSTIDSTYGYEYLFAPRQSAVKIATRYRTPSNSHYRITAALSVSMGGILLGTETASEMGFLFGFRDSGGKYVTYFPLIESSNWRIYIYKWNSSTSANSAYKTYGSASGILHTIREVIWLRMDYDGTNIIFYTSIDGNNFHQFDTRVLTDFLASGKPDAAYGAYVNGAEVAVALLSWEETALP